MSSRSGPAPALPVSAGAQAPVTASAWRRVMALMLPRATNPCRTLNYATPAEALNEHLLAQVKELEGGARQRGLHNLDELEARRAALYNPGIGPR